MPEVYSGPAFRKLPFSSVLAVMRHEGAKAQDYAKRRRLGMILRMP
jgi:hypothetical protein